MAVRGTIRHRRWVPLAQSLVLLGIGLAGTKHYVVDALQAVRLSWCVRPHPMVSQNGILLSCSLLLLGLLGALTTAVRWRSARAEGPPWDYLLRDPATRRMTQRGWLLSAAIVAAAFLVYAWVQQQMWMRGYV